MATNPARVRASSVGERREHAGEGLGLLEKRAAAGIGVRVKLCRPSKTPGIARRPNHSR